MDINHDLTIRLYDAKENDWEHNTFFFEQQLLDYVRRGEVILLKEFLQSTQQTLNEGVVADNPLRQAKNIFIGLISMIGKEGAIRGGVSIEETYQLIDVYIQECERLQSVDSIRKLQYDMILDFTKRVENAKIPGGYSGEVYACIQFIRAHSNKIITVDDVAAYINRSRSYISRKFKNELKNTIGFFIMHTKLEEAKSLLLYSDKSLSEISNYLGFSSQSYFQNLYKKKYGLTPGQFRNQVWSKMLHS